MFCSSLLRAGRLGLAALCFAVVGVFAQDATAPEEGELTAEQQAALAEAMSQMSFAQQLQAVGVPMTTGPATAQLGDIAEVKLPEGYHFVGADGLELFYELTQNMLNGNEVGVVLSPDGWMLFFDFDDIGYVADDEKDDLDAAELMESMVDGQEAANEARAERGWDQMRLQGWVQQPHYDTQTNNLKWAFNLSSSTDNFQETWINQNIRLLGRTGVMNVTMVGNPANFAAEEAAADALLANNFSYLPGERYAEFKEGDKVAQYGLAALVLGGAGAVAAKTGLLAKLGIMLGKFWKFIAIGVIAFFSFFKNLFRRLTGSHPVEKNDDAPNA
ncbi:DUF2167 domain-containing protein [Actomonas aquatica]|uniref:DUF2167 domain-containing protein n=1 Tax=Actomonas aquatica TaxID=2866162 RepID=A0ABZ1CEZ5_9BACT|nr:DUF2167 domain-containing protein [Opitutus sp. WL0086]WRQ89169.1 DUF2167 domain-containing protein [Opitutus sp. WL0086]